MKSEEKYFLGLDPGKSGGWAVLKDGELLACGSFHKDEEKTELRKMIQELPLKGEVLGIIEKVGPMPKQGVKSTFSFGVEFGKLQGHACQGGIKLEFIPPKRWQSELLVRELTDEGKLEDTKVVSLRTATELFPNFAHKFKRKSIDHGTSDAALLAYYGWKNGLL